MTACCQGSPFRGLDSSDHDGFPHPPVDTWLAPEFRTVTMNAAENILSSLLCSYKLVFSDFSLFSSGAYNCRVFMGSLVMNMSDCFYKIKSSYFFHYGHV